MGFRFPDITKLPNFKPKSKKTPERGVAIRCPKCGRSTGTLRKIGPGEYAHAKCMAIRAATEGQGVAG